MISPASDEELLARQSALQAEAGEVLAGLDLAALVADIGPLLVAGSFVSGLMCWRELDVMVHVGGDFSPQDVPAAGANCRAVTARLGRTGQATVGNAHSNRHHA